MRILIAEDDYASRRFMQNFLSRYGECDVTVDGKEALDAFLMALEEKEPYDLICLDIMMPLLDGYEVLRAIREKEKEEQISEEEESKVIMTTALGDSRTVKKAFDLGCVAYAGKPIDKEKFERQLKKLGLI